METTLGPGEVLWLPSFYWNHVRQLDEGQHNLSLNCWVGAKGDGSQATMIARDCAVIAP